MIIQCIANSHLQYVKDKATAYQMWQSLGSVFQRKGIASQLYLRKKLLSLKLQEGTPLEMHFLNFEETVRELKSVGTKLEQIDIVCQLLLSLPKEYDGIVTALETLEVERLTMEFVKAKLLDQEIKKSSQQEGNSDDMTAFSSNSRTNYNRKKQFSPKRNHHYNNAESQIQKDQQSTTAINGGSQDIT